MLLGVAGPGGQFPRPVPVPHIIQGVLGIRFAPLLLYLLLCVFATIFAHFRRFRPFLHCFLHFWPPGPTHRAEPAAGTQKHGAGRQRGAATPHPGGPWPPPHRAGPPARSAAAESAGGRRADRGQASPAQSDRRAASPAGAGRGGARPPWRVPPPPGRRDRLPRTPAGPAAAARGAARRR